MSPNDFHVSETVWWVVQDGGGGILFDDRAVSKSAGAFTQPFHPTSNEHQNILTTVVIS
jgi:hypothetical protein